MAGPVEGLAHNANRSATLLAGNRARREVAQIRRGHNMPPTLPQWLAQFTWHAFPNCVDAIALAPIESRSHV